MEEELESTLINIGLLAAMILTWHLQNTGVLFCINVAGHLRILHSRYECFTLLFSEFRLL